MLKVRLYREIKEEDFSLRSNLNIVFKGSHFYLNSYFAGMGLADCILLGLNLSIKYLFILSSSSKLIV